MGGPEGLPAGGEEALPRRGGDGVGEEDCGQDGGDDRLEDLEGWREDVLGGLGMGRVGARAGVEEEGVNER